MQTKVVNIKKHKKGENDIYIGRGKNSKWGNPFTHKEGNTLAKFKVTTREESLIAYESYLRESPLLDDLHELRGKTLVCFCKPLPCHGDILIKLINEKFKNTLF